MSSILSSEVAFEALCNRNNHCRVKKSTSVSVRSCEANIFKPPLDCQTTDSENALMSMSGAGKTT